MICGFDKLIATTTQIYSVTVVYLLTTISLFFNIYAAFTTTLLGTIYPAYKFLEAGHRNDTEGLKGWGAYFVVVSTLVTLADLGAEMWIKRLPFYWVAKMVILYWLAAPQYMVFLGPTSCFQ